MRRNLDVPELPSWPVPEGDSASRQLERGAIAVPVDPGAARLGIRSALLSRERSDAPDAVVQILIVCTDVMLATMIRRRFEGAASTTRVVTGSAAAFAAMDARGPSTVVVVESSDRNLLAAIGGRTALSPVLAFVTFGDAAQSGEHIDPWRVGAHGHFSFDDLNLANVQRAIAYATACARAAAVEAANVEIRDRSERNETVGEARAERARFDAVVARSGDLVMFFDPDGTITWASPASVPMFGIEPVDLIGMNGLSLIHPDDHERVMADFSSVPALGDHVRTEYRVVGPDGDVRWIEEVVTNLLDEPSVASIVGNLHDITDRRLALEAVEFHARLLAAAGQAIIAVDPDNTVVYWNAAAHQMYGWTVEEAIGANIGSLVSPVEGWDERHLDADPMARGGRSWTGELWVRRKDGTQFPALIANTALYGDDGAHVATISVSSDISERLHSEATASRLASIVQCSNDAIFSTDLAGRIASWNPAAVRLFGYESAETIGRHVRMLVPPDMQAELDGAMERVVAGHSISMDATVALRADSSVVDLSTSMSPLRDRSGAVVGASMMGRDITERIEYDRRITADRRRLEEAQTSAGFGSFEIDLVANTLTRSDEFWRIIGRAPNDQPGHDFSFVHPDDLPQVEDALRRVLEGHSAVDCTHRVVRPTGEVRWVVTRTSRFRDPSDLVIAGTMLDITDRREAELATEHLAFHDPLTGLANRSKITTYLDEQLNSYGGGQGIAVVLVDLDQFKVINDSLGHSAGDGVLTAVARRIESVLEPAETLARFGGDEFAVIRCSVTGLDECTELGERLLASFDAPIMVDRRDFHLSMSIGITLSEAGDSADSLFREADTAMYHAKETGRARMALYGEALQAASRRRLDLREALQTALQRDEMSIVYQPVTGLTTMRTSGFEALLRWVSPTFGPVSPDEFIPIAEETGLIVAIGEWVLGEALAQIAEWRRETPHGHQPWVAVNVSARQIESRDLVDRVATALTHAGVPAEALHLELTESILMDTTGSSTETMNALHHLGIKLSIDDFGTGYSSLSYLKRLPIDTLKIDKSFVDGLGAEADDTSIVQAIISLARTLGMDVLAEGVETEAQLQALIDLGCDYGQGFHWSPGVPAAQAAAWIDR